MQAEALDHARLVGATFTFPRHRYRRVDSALTRERDDVLRQRHYERSRRYLIPMYSGNPSPIPACVELPECANDSLAKTQTRCKTLGYLTVPDEPFVYLWSSKQPLGDQSRHA